MYKIIPRDFGLHFARVLSPDVISNDTLSTLGPELTRASRSLLPDGSLDVVSYACTSGSLVLGEQKVFDCLLEGAPNARASSLITAVIRAMRSLQIKRVSVLTPYLDEINQAEKNYLENSGFHVCSIEGFNISLDSEMVTITPEYLLKAARLVDRQEADAIFISCGALRSIDIIEPLEHACGKPVITSNQALAWDVMTLCDYERPVPGFGVLLNRQGA